MLGSPSLHFGNSQFAPPATFSVCSPAFPNLTAGAEASLSPKDVAVSRLTAVHMVHALYRGYTRYLNRY